MNVLTESPDFFSKIDMSSIFSYSSMAVDMLHPHIITYILPQIEVSQQCGSIHPPDDLGIISHYLL